MCGKALGLAGQSSAPVDAVVGPICQRLLAALAEAKERRRVSLVTRGCSRRSKGDEELTWSSLASIFAGEERKEGKKRGSGFRGQAASRRRGVSQEPTGRR
ncbi:hypothetical protein KY289_000732 [Solanum tuberosum]|nr:hypothetical protein KY289_000732 [Solanum tuberosum]